MIRLNPQNRYIQALQYTFLVSVVLAPIALRLVTEAIQRRMPPRYSLELSIGDILKILLLCTTVITLAVSIALVTQYFYIVNVIELRVNCTSRSSQTTAVRPKDLPVHKLQVGGVALPAGHLGPGDSVAPHTSHSGVNNPLNLPPSPDTPHVSVETLKKRLFQETPTMM